MIYKLKKFMLLLLLKEMRTNWQKTVSRKTKGRTIKQISNSKEESRHHKPNIKKLTPNEKLVLFNTKLINNL